MSKINETNYPRRTQANYEDTDMIVIQEAGGNTHTTRIEDLREDCQETLAPALDTMRENLATIEGITASKAYAKGDYLVFDGRLCKAKTSIAVNATLILDTNIELASVGGELSSINSDLATLITVKSYTVTFTENAVVAAEFSNIYKATGEVVLTSDVALYGTPIAINVTGYGGIALPAAVRYVTAQSKWIAYALATRANTDATSFIVTFAKKATVV